MRHSFFLSSIMLFFALTTAPTLVLGDALLEDDFEAGLDTGVWDVRPNRGSEWIHAVEAGNGYIIAEPIGGSPFSQFHRFTQVITHQTDFGDFEMTWDMRYDNSGTHRDHRHIHFRSIWDQATIPRGIIAPSTQGYFVWTGVNIPGVGSVTAILRRNSDGYMTGLTPRIGYPWQVGVWYSHRLKVEGNEFKFKAWERSTPEPEGWTLTAVDPDALYSHGGIGFGNYWAALTRVDNVTVAIPTAVDQIGDVILNIIDLELHTGIETGLVAKLEGAIQILEDENLNNDVAAIQILEDENLNNDVAAINKLEAAINQIEALSGDKIPTEQADDLIAEIQAIIDRLTNA